MQGRFYTALKRAPQGAHNKKTLERNFQVFLAARSGLEPLILP